MPSPAALGDAGVIRELFVEWPAWPALVSSVFMLGITDYLWRLVPANPILLRVVDSGGKRVRDLIIRCGYLGLLIILAVFLYVTSLSQASGLSELAKISATMFQSMSYLQLGLVALLAPIFTAGAITQEKDSQTYDILLSTPLTNGQIVLGSLLSRLFFIIALLVSGIPIFSITQIFGGVAIGSIVVSFGIAAATAFVTGALAMAIATFKVGTRRTIFSFYLFIAIYLLGLFFLDQSNAFHIVLGHQTTAAGQLVMQDGHSIPIYSKTSWLTGLHPFLALRTIFGEPGYTPPAFGELPASLQRWPIGWYLSNPASFYMAFMFTLSLVLVLPSIVLLRRAAQSSNTVRGWFLQKLHLSSGDRTRKPRAVWNNPIAWREARTKSSAARATVLRYGFILLGLAAAGGVIVMHATERPAALFVKSNSYDPELQNILVYADTGNATPYKLAPGARVSIGGTPILANEIDGKYEIKPGGIQLVQSQIVSLKLTPIKRLVSEADARNYLLGIVLIEFFAILLIVTNAAASTVTREKEDGTLDLLLTTPITSRYYIWGKLRGLVSFVLPLLAVPVVSVLAFAVYDMVSSMAGGGAGRPWVVFPEAALVMPGTLVIIVAFAAIVGMQMSLRCRKTVVAVMSGVGIVLGVCGALGWCGNSLLANSGVNGSTMGLVLGSFSPITVLTVLLNPYQFAPGAFSSPGDAAASRTILFIFAWIATGAYAGVVWWMYKSMVRNFDMTIRRQSR